MRHLLNNFPLTAFTSTAISSAKELTLLSATTQFALLSLGYTNAEEIAQSESSQDVETIRSRQAHYINWYMSNHVIDPVGPDQG